MDEASPPVVSSIVQDGEAALARWCIQVNTFKPRFSFGCLVLSNETSPQNQDY